MKTNLKYQNGSLPASPKKKNIRTSLGFCALIVIGAYLVCSLALSPASDSLRESYNYMTTDVEYNGTFTHKLTLVGSQVLFYLSSLLSTVGFFVGASYVANLTIAGRKKGALGAAGITFLGMNVGTLLTVGAFLILRIGTPRVTIPDSTLMTFLSEGLFALVCVGAVTAGTFLLAAKRAPVLIYPLTCATIMFVGAVGMELIENIPFFLNGTVLAEDTVKMILSILLYVVHAFVGFMIMLHMTRRPKKA